MSYKQCRIEGIADIPLTAEYESLTGSSIVLKLDQPSLETLSEAPVGVLKNVLQLNQVIGAHEVLR